MLEEDAGGVYVQLEDALHLAVTPQLKCSSPWCDRNRHDESLDWRLARPANRQVVCLENTSLLDSRKPELQPALG